MRDDQSPGSGRESPAVLASGQPTAADDTSLQSGRQGNDRSAATLYDVARIAGVSTATVSRVVHGLDRVRDSTRARVQEVIEQLGYVPDGAAQSLSRRRKYVIGLACVERQSPRQQNDIESMSLLFYDEILRGVEAQIRHHNWSLLITYLREASPSELPRLLNLSAKVDGLLIGEGIVPSPVLARLAKRIPVLVIAGSPGEQAVDVVTADNRGGATALVTHLITAHGRRRLYLVDGPPTAPDASERRIGLANALDANSECELVGSSVGNFTAQSGVMAGERILALPAEAMPDAIVCANDQMAIGAIQALTKGNVRVPEDVAVVGFDDIFPSSLLESPLTTVHQPMRQLGERSCARLLERIARPQLRPHVELLPTELVIRSSCGCPPGTNNRLRVMPRPVTRVRAKTIAAGRTARAPQLASQADPT